jgi:hypothetical protein
MKTLKLFDSKRNVPMQMVRNPGMVYRVCFWIEWQNQNYIELKTDTDAQTDTDVKDSSDDDHVVCC